MALVYPHYYLNRNGQNFRDLNPIPSTENYNLIVGLSNYRNYSFTYLFSAADKKTYIGIFKIK
jgi:hypothetical protein